MPRTINRKRVSAPRPISKSMIAFSQPIGNNTTTQEINLFITTFPCTVTGLRWELNSPMESTNFTEEGYFSWAIVVVKEGNDANSLPSGAITSGLSFYNPEQNVLAAGMGYPVPQQSTAYSLQWDGKTKTMRKLQTGDRLVLLYSKGEIDTTSDAFFGGIVQFFTKS